MRVTVTNGDTMQVLLDERTTVVKTTVRSGDLAQGTPGVQGVPGPAGDSDLPSAGAPGDVLTKVDATSDAAEWRDSAIDWASTNW